MLFILDIYGSPGYASVGKQVVVIMKLLPGHKLSSEYAIYKIMYKNSVSSLKNIRGLS